MAMVSNIHQAIRIKPIILILERKVYKKREVITPLWIDEPRKMSLSLGKWITEALNPESDPNGYSYTNISSPFDQCSLMLPSGVTSQQMIDQLSLELYGETGKISMIDLGRA